MISANIDALIEPSANNSIQFSGIIGNNSELLTSAFDKQFVISEFDSFQNDIRRIYNDCSTNTFGCTTNYTKYLSSAPSQDDWGVSICSVDGQRCGFGSNTKAGFQITHPRKAFLQLGKLI